MANNRINPISKRNLKIIHINVNSLILISRRYDLRQFINKHNPDIILLNETKLNRRHKLHFDNYNMIRKDRNGALRGGGTGILIKNNLKYNIYSNNTINSFKFLETCIIKLPMGANEMLYVISGYYPSGNNDSDFRTEIHNLFNSLGLQSSSNYYILAGDLNARHTDWGNPSCNSKGNKLKDWLSDSEINFRCRLYASCSPSYPRSGSYLDVCIADCRLHIVTENNTLNCLRTLDYDSDHQAIQMVTYMGTEEQLFTFMEETENLRYNYKGTNWHKFRNKIIREVQSKPGIPKDRNLSNVEIETYVNDLNDLIVRTMENCTPKYRNRDSFCRMENTIVRKLHSEKSQILTIIKKHNRLEHTLTESELNLAKAKMKLIRKLLKENIAGVLNKHLREKLTQIDPGDSRNMFEEIRKNFRKFQPLQLENIKIPQNLEYILSSVSIDPDSLEKDSSNNFILREPDQMLDAIGSLLESVHSYKQVDHNNAVQLRVSEVFNTFLETKNHFENNQFTITNFNARKMSNDLDDTQADNYFVTKEKILYIFSKLKGKLSSGIDTIPNIVLKNIPEILIFEYSSLFNNMLNNSYFPNNWKKAKVVLLPKKNKDMSNPKNIRAISLLPNISKIFEMCVNDNIIKFCSEKGLTNEKQFGFKYKHSTVNAVHLLTSNINWYWNKRLSTGACFIDMEKAFDNIWIPGLVVKLLDLRFPIHQIILIYNMISNKSFMVFHQKYRSNKTFEIVNGLQQGTVNSPTLFNLFILDLLSRIENVIAFADDIVIYHADDTIDKINNNLQQSFNIVEQYSVDWNMRINTMKCETILFRPPVNKCNNNIKKNWKSFGIKSNYNNVDIPNKQVVKYLGINLDKFLYFNNHVNETIIKARNAFFSYKSLFYSKYINPRVKIIMYQSLIRPILTYGCPIWYNISPSYMEKIRLFERKCLRSCTSLFRSPQSNYVKFISNKKLYNKSNIIRIDNFIINLIRNNILRCTSCIENNLIMAPYYTSENYISKALLNGFGPPEAFLYLDKLKIIQNENGIPIFYHNYRRATTKAVICNTTNNNNRYDKSISNRDLCSLQRTNAKKYWWLYE